MTFETMGDIFRYINSHEAYFGFKPTAIGLTKEEQDSITAQWGLRAFPNVEGYPPSVMGIPLITLEN